MEGVGKYIKIIYLQKYISKYFITNDSYLF